MDYYEGYKMTLVDELWAEYLRIDEILVADAEVDFLSPMEANDKQYIAYELSAMLGNFDILQDQYDQMWVNYAHGHEPIPF
jgi:hypothetical protein